MIENKKKEIDGTIYKVAQMDAIRGLKAQTKLIKILGPAVGKAAISGGIEGDIKEKILSHLMDNFDDNEVSDFILGLFDKGVFFTTDSGEDEMVIFKDHFTGEPAKIWKVAFFILSVNFGSLMGKLTGGFSLLKNQQSGSQKEN